MTSSIPTGFASLGHRTATVVQLVGVFYAENRRGGSNLKNDNVDRVKTECAA